MVNRRLMTALVLGTMVALMMAMAGMASAQVDPAPDNPPPGGGGKGPLAGKAVKTVNRDGGSVDRLLINAKDCKVARKDAFIIVRDRDGTRGKIPDERSLSGFTTEIRATNKKVIVKQPVFRAIKGGDGSLELPLTVVSSEGIRCR